MLDDIITSVDGSLVAREAECEAEKMWFLWRELIAKGLDRVADALCKEIEQRFSCACHVRLVHDEPLKLHVGFLSGVERDAENTAVCPSL